MSPSPDAPGRTARRLVLVVGAGRSGTSTAVGVLRDLGAHVPQPEVAADASNPRGFGEPRWVVDLHDELLARAAVQVADARPDAWHRVRSTVAEARGARVRLEQWLADELAGHDTVVVKDPRLAWFLPMWREVAVRLGEEPAFVTMLRPPPEVVGSRRRRYNHRLEDAHGVAGWLNLMLGTEHETRGTHRLLVGYHDLLTEPAATARRLAAGLGLPEPTGDPGFVDRGLHRVQATWEDLTLPARLDELAGRAWSCLDTLACGGAPDLAEGDLDAVRAEYDAYYREAESVARSSVLAAAVPAQPAAAPRRSRLPRWLRGRAAGPGHPPVPRT